MALQVVLGGLIAALLAHSAISHGGALHEWPSTPTGSNYIRTEIAQCSNWVPGNGQVVSSLAGANATSKHEVRGDVTIWNYLYHNCSLAEGEVPTAGAEFNATLLQDGKPASNVTIDGITMTGTCASGGGRPYYFNASADPIDDNENLLWFHNYTTGLDGRMHGNGANDGIVSTAANDGIKSVMLVDHNTRDSIACCDLIFAGPLNTKWEQNLFGKGENCSDMAGMDHDTVGMDHNMHDGSSHHDKGSNSSAIAGGAATARNSAGVASVGMGAAAAAGAGMAMLFALLL